MRKLFDIQNIPEFIVRALDQNNLWAQYRQRPVYQQSCYIGWIIKGKRDSTRRKRLHQMMEELKSGIRYMGMKYDARI